VRIGPIFCVALLVACSREAEVQQGDPFVLDDAPIPEVPDSGVPSVLDGELASPELTSCAERPIAAHCVGSNDFPCRVSNLVPRVVEACQLEVPCRASGWLTISTDSGGCFSDIGMTRPSPDLVACLVELLGELRCPCDAQTVTQYLGFGTDECRPTRPSPPLE
jgi:hypothetical protein